MGRFRRRRRKQGWSEELEAAHKIMKEKEIMDTGVYPEFKKKGFQISFTIFW